MQDYLKTGRELQLEGLSRIVQHSEQYDCAMISGYIAEKDTSRKEQKRRHARLLATLKPYNFFIISLKRAWKDKHGKIEKERSFFVVNKGKEERMSLVKFSHTISKLGAEYRQESVLIVPPGALSGKSRAYLINTDAPTKKAYISSAKSYHLRQSRRLAKVNRSKRFTQKGRPPRRERPTRQTASVDPDDGRLLPALGCSVVRPPHPCRWSTHSTRAPRNAVR